MLLFAGHVVFYFDVVVVAVVGGVVAAVVGVGVVAACFDVGVDVPGTFFLCLYVLLLCTS